MIKAEIETPLSWFSLGLQKVRFSLQKILLIGFFSFFKNKLTIMILY